MEGGDFMSTLEANLALLSTIPEECQKEIQSYLLLNFCGSNPYKPLSGDEILSKGRMGRTWWVMVRTVDLQGLEQRRNKAWA